MARDGGKTWKRALLGGLALAAVPVIGLNVLLAINLTTATQREVDGITGEVLNVAEARLDDAAGMLIALGLKGVSTCGPNDLEELRAASRDAPFVAEIAVVDSAGVAQCADFGAPRAVRRTSPEHGALRPNLMLSIVHGDEDGGSPFIRIQWRFDNGWSLRLLLPGKDILPQLLRNHASAAFIAQVMTIDGTPIVRHLLDPALDQAEASFAPSTSATVASQRYPIEVHVEVPGAALMQANQQMFLYANLCGLGFTLVAAGIAVLMSRRSGGPVREISDGIRKGEFVPYYQPVIDIVSGRLKGCEVLVRWKKPDGRILVPGHFITLAEASGEIFPMTIALMEAARADLAECYARRPGLKVGFNLFAGHFDDVTIVDDVRRIFDGSPILLTQLMFEVTERQPLHDIRMARTVISKLQGLGARVALDDVGTGHGGLSYLLKLGFDVMKMDKMFVDAIGTDRYSIAIVDSLVKLANAMNLDLIAEGVETFEQVEYLRAKGVRMAQGYVFAPPLPAKSFVALVEAMTPLDHADMIGYGRPRRSRPAA